MARRDKKVFLNEQCKEIEKSNRISRDFLKKLEISRKHFMQSESEVIQSCLTLCNSMDCSPLGSSVHEILQARILEWVTISFTRGSTPPRDQSCNSCTGKQILYHWDTWEALWLRVNKKVMCCFYIFVGLLTFNMWRSAAIILVVKKLGDTLQFWN